MKNNMKKSGKGEYQVTTDAGVFRIFNNGKTWIVSKKFGEFVDDIFSAKSLSGAYNEIYRRGLNN